MPAFLHNNECLQQQSLGSHQPPMRHDLSRSRRQSGREEGGKAVFSVDLQMSLLNAWNKYGVAEYHQNIFLAHLDEQLPRVVEDKIKREVKQTLQKSSYFFQLESLHNQRHYLQQEIKDQLRGITNDASDEELVSPLRKVRLLREVNLDEAETIIKMYQEYHCKDSEMRSKQLKEFAMLIDMLQQSTGFIRASPLSSHIRCGEGFDPFFMNNYQPYHRQPSRNAAEALRELYSLNISSVYRLMKAKSMLSDIRTASQEQTQKKKRQRQRERFRFQSLPTLQTEHQLAVSNRNRAIPPIDIPNREKTSRTTIHPLYKERPQSSYTEQYSKPKLKLTKAAEEIQSNYSRSKVKKNIVYLRNDLENKQSDKKYNFNHNQSQLEGRNRQQTLPNDLLDYKRMHPRPDQHKFSLKPYHVGVIGAVLQPNKVVQFKNYNPIKGESFQVNITPRSNSRYDYSPQSGPSYIPQIQYDKDKRLGLQYQSPIHKHGPKNKRWQGEVYKQPNQEKAVQKPQKIDREMQTMEMKAVVEKEPVPVRKKVQQPEQQQEREPPRVVKASRPVIGRDDDVIEDEDIIDERPPNHNQKKQPLIREVSKQPSMKQSPPAQQQRKSPPKQQQKRTEQKKQIKMKVGKLTIKEMLALLQNIKIDQQYKKFFDMEKLIPWIKTSQTYLTQFHINDICAVVALSSPLPSIGTAIKLWAPIAGQANPAISINLFTRYIEHIQKSTTAAKILYQGDGQGFQELQKAGFLKKKEGLYERARQLPASKSGSQFKPFLYVECSSVNFAQSGKESVIFSSQIQEFSNKNSLVAKFIGSINAATVPQPLRQLVKIDNGLKSFKEVNNILGDEQFDEYEASLVKASNIQLLRIYMNTSLKSTFLAAQGLIKFVGNLLYESGQQCLIALPTLKHNGTLLFSKNMSFDAIQQKSKASSGTRVNFSVTMFSKKLYGRLSGFPPGSYGNFEVNLTFQDQMQGKIKHNLKIEKCFGPEPFMVSLDVEKTLLFCLGVGEEDFIY